MISLALCPMFHAYWLLVVASLRLRVIGPLVTCHWPLVTIHNSLMIDDCLLLIDYFLCPMLYAVHIFNGLSLPDRAFRFKWIMLLAYACVPTGVK